jgi:hypothetical protein
MAQTESLMLIGLGFVLALLLVMAFGRGVWSLSNNFAKRQRNRDLPAAMLSLEADRDRLRAENAAMASKLEVVSEHAKAAIASQTAEVARHRNRVVGLTEDINEKSVELHSKIDIADDLKVQLQDLGETLELQQRASRELTADNVEKEATIKRLEADIDALKLEISDGKTDLYRVSAQLEDARSETAALKQEMAEAVSHSVRYPRPAPEPAPERVQQFEAQPENTAENTAENPFEQSADPAQTRPETQEAAATSRAARFNFDKPGSIRLARPALPPVQQPDIKEVLLEARRDLIDLARANPAGDVGQSGPAQGVISLAKRLRALQAKSDEKVSKTLK